MWPRILYIGAASLVAAGLVFIFVDQYVARIGISYPPPEHEVYIANLGANSILGFAINRSEIPERTVARTPGRVIQGELTGLSHPVDVALDGSGRIYVANLGDSVVPPSITVYPADASGEARPIRTITQFNVQGVPSAFRRPKCLVIRPDPQSILVIDEPLPGPPDATRILEFSTIAGSDDAIGRYTLTGVTPPTTGIALDALQRIYVVSRDSYLLVYLEPAQQFMETSPLCGSVNTGYSGSEHSDVATDTRSHSYVLSLFGHPYPSEDWIFVSDIRDDNLFGCPFSNDRLVGLSTYADPRGIAADDDGRIFVTLANGLMVLPPGAVDVTRAQTVTHPAIFNPQGIAVR